MALVSTKQDSAIRYENRLVAWLDILGFSKLIEQEDKLSIIKELRDDIKRQLGTKPSINISLISDTIVASIKLGDGAKANQKSIEDLWRIISELQCKLLFRESFYECSICFRGAVARGLVMHDELGAFGPVIAQLNKYEKDVAIHPRVILTEGFYSEVPEALLEDLFRKDRDGFYFIDFLKYQKKDSTKTQSFDGDLHNLINKIGSRVADLHSQYKYSVAAKWQWLHQYCGSYGNGVRCH